MKRVLLKISGESLSSERKSIDPMKAQNLADMIAEITKTGVELVIVMGGGNIYRGSKLIEAGVNPANSHNMSMLSTVFNSVALQDFLHRAGKDSVVMDAFGIEFLERFIISKALKYISEGKLVICSSGTGTPFFTTDTTGVVRALETHCEAMIKLTKVDGVYDSDPVTNPDAQRIDEITYDEIIAQDLKILDQTAIIMARDNNLPIYITKLDDMESILDIIGGGKSGTKIS